jgi:hypothetical protein
MRLWSILLIWFIASASCLLRAQTPGKITAVIDSIEAQLPAMASDTNKVHALNRLAFEYNSVSPYDGIRYALEGLSLAEIIWAPITSPSPIIPMPTNTGCGLWKSIGKLATPWVK